MKYVPGSFAGHDVSSLRLYALRELVRVSNAINAGSDKVTLPVLTEEPGKPQVGDIVFADGTDWNPGSGRGLYYYDTTWNFIA